MLTFCVGSVIYFNYYFALILSCFCLSFLLIRCSIISLNVRGLRDQIERKSIFSYLRDQKATFCFLQETYSNSNDEVVWKAEWGGDIVFSHGSCHSRGVCILIYPKVKGKIELLFQDNSGRIVLITSEINGLKVSLCNIYAQNNSVDQLRFLQELYCCLMDKADITTLIVGGDWNCALTKKDKSGGAPWKPATYCNSLLITMDIFDLMDIQRIRHPSAKKFLYVSKALKMRSLIDFFLISKNLKFCKKGRQTILYRTGSQFYIPVVDMDKRKSQRTRVMEIQ